MPPGSIAIGIETEFPVTARSVNPNILRIEDFSKSVAAGYVQSLRSQPHKEHPVMHDAISETFRGERYSEWSLDTDSTIETPNKGQQPCS